MATQYPNGIDNTSSLPYVTNGVSPMVGDDVNRLRDAVVAVETELGANPSGTFTSVDARIEAAETAISDYANSTFLVLSADGFISQERVFSPSVNFAVVDGGAGANYEIDLASSVGIGTSTPASDYSLTLDGDGVARIGGLTLRNSGADTFYIGTVTAADATNISLMNPNAGYVTLGTDGAERIRITSAGDVGLGTSLPVGLLHVSGGDLLVETGDVGIGTTTPAGRLHISSGDLLVETGDVGIGTTTPAGRVHISSGDLLVETGDVGIGTLTPSELLHISGGNLLLESAVGAGLPYATMKGTQGGVQLSSSNSIGKLDILDSTGAVAISLLNSGDNRLVGANSADFSFYTSNTEKMRITAGGDLLVNSTANPDLARLHISGGGITHSSSQFNARPGAGVNYEWVNRDGAGHTWYVNSAATQAMTIASTGNVGIGTISPAAQLSVGSSSEFRVDSSGDIVRIKNVPYVFPAAQGVASSALRNNGSGGLDWSLVQDTEIIGGLQTVADTAARDDIPSAQRKEGMVVYSQADDRHFVLEGGVTNGDWKELGDDGRLVGGMRVVSNLSTIPLAKQKVDMLVMLSTTNTVYRLNATSTPPIPAANWVKLFTAHGGTDSISALSMDELYLAGVGMRQIEASHVRNIKGRESTADLGSSRVSWGLELLPTTVSLLPDFAPAALLKPGRGVSANGSQVNPPLDITADLTDAANYLPSSSPPVSYPANIYVFVDYDQQLRFSNTAPDQFGRPATAEFGYSVDDYVYVGLMRPKTDVGGDHVAVWGSFSVSHDGLGSRLIALDPEESGLYGEFNLSWPSGGPTTTTEDVGPATAPSSLFPTASSVKTKFELRCRGLSITSGFGYGEASAIFVGGTLYSSSLDVDSNITIGPAPWFSDSVVFDMPNRNVQPKMKITRERTGGGSARTLIASARYCAITENTNNPVPVFQSDFDL